MLQKNASAPRRDAPTALPVLDGAAGEDLFAQPYRATLRGIGRNFPAPAATAAPRCGARRRNSGCGTLQAMKPLMCPPQATPSSPLPASSVSMACSTRQNPSTHSAGRHAVRMMNAHHRPGEQIEQPVGAEHAGDVAAGGDRHDPIDRRQIGGLVIVQGDHRFAMVRAPLAAGHAAGSFPVYPVVPEILGPPPSFCREAPREGHESHEGQDRTGAVASSPGAPHTLRRFGSDTTHHHRLPRNRTAKASSRSINTGETR